MLAIHAVPAFRDNYIWVLEDGVHAAAVDPGDAAPVQAFLERQGLELAAVLATHHHADHVGGLVELARRWKPEIMAGLTKHGKHEALADIHESIGELKYYREHLLKV